MEKRHTGSRGAPGRAGHALGMSLCLGDRPCGGPCSPGQLTPLLWPPLCTHAVAGDHKDGKLLLLSWEMSIFHNHPQTFIHQSKLVSSLMNHLVRDCKGYLDQEW